MNAVVYLSHMCAYIYIYIVSLKCPHLLQPSLSAVIMKHRSHFCFCNLLISLYNVCSEIILKCGTVRANVQERNPEL